MTTTTSNFTKEQLIEFAEERIARTHPAAPPHAQAKKALYEIALAALTAKPAMYCMQKGEALDIDATSTCKSVVDAWVGEWNEMQCEHGDDFSAVSLYRLPMVEGLSNDQ